MFSVLVVQLRGTLHHRLRLQRSRRPGSFLLSRIVSSLLCVCLAPAVRCPSNTICQSHRRTSKRLAILDESTHTTHDLFCLIVIAFCSVLFDSTIDGALRFEKKAFPQLAATLGNTIYCCRNASCAQRLLSFHLLVFNLFACSRAKMFSHSGVVVFADTPRIVSVLIQAVQSLDGLNTEGTRFILAIMSLFCVCALSNCLVLLCVVMALLLIVFLSLPALHCPIVSMLFQKYHRVF